LLAHALAQDAAHVDERLQVEPPADAAQGRVEALLDWLESHRYLSQERFVESRVYARAARFGNLRIRQELAQHDVALPGRTERLLADSELERAQAVWARKFAGPPANAAEHARQVRFLAGRGFSAEVIHNVLRAAARPGVATRGDVPDAD
jgi:regulatory protein